MTHGAELGLAPIRLAIEPGLRVRGALMCVVLALLAMKVGSVAVVEATPRLEVRGPGLDECAINREVLVREQGFHARMLDQLGHELLEHAALLKPVPVLGEHRWIPHWIIWRQSDKPAEEKIVIELLHELTLRTDAVEHLQEKRTQELLRRDRWPALMRVELAKTVTQLLQHLPHAPRDGWPESAPLDGCTRTTRS